MGPPNKKRKLKESKTEEVVFDPTARFDYLTGFHKRKVERTKKAREAAAVKARQEKIENRKEVRDERKKDLEAHVKAVNAALLPVQPPAPRTDDGSQDSNSEDGWEGILDPTPDPIDHEEEYIDEDKYTTVVVEEVDISRDGITKLNGAEEEGEVKTEVVQQATESDKQKKAAPKKARDKGKKPRKKKRDFKYESPADRKTNRTKERARKSKAAKIRRGD